MSTRRNAIFSGLMYSAGLGVGLLSLPAFPQDAATPAPPAEGAAPAADPFAVEEGDFFLLREPETAEEFFKGAVQAQQLGRPNLARQYLERFLELNPDDDTLLKLRDQYGPAAFARLANQKELQPLSTQLNARVGEVFRQRGASTERIDALLAALSESPEKAYPAREALINAGDAVIPAILSRLPAERDDHVRQQLLDILAGMRTTALPALHAALDTPDETLRIQVISVIGRIGSDRSIPALYFSAYGPQQSAGVRAAARRALEQISKLSQATTEAVEPADVALQLQKEAAKALAVLPPNVDEAATAPQGTRVWSWSDEDGTVRSAMLDARSAALWHATRMARESFLIAPDRPAAQALYLALLMEAEATRTGGVDPPTGPGTAFNTALAAGPELAGAILQQSLEYDLPRGAVGALTVLAKTAAPGTLFGEEDGLVAGLNATDRRVQLAAAVAVLRLNPDRPFRHSGRIVEILTQALSEASAPTAVIIDPDTQRGSTVAGFAREMGYESQLAASGQEGFRLATERIPPDVLLVNLNVSRWPLSQTLANFRADVRTRDIPIIVFGPAERDWLPRTVSSSRYTYFGRPGATDPRADVTEYLSEIPRTAYVIETTTTAAFAAQVRPLLTAYVSDPLTEDERAQSRAIAAFWLAQIADTGKTDVYPLEPAEQALIGALSDPANAANALIALSAIKTPSAQAAIAQQVIAPTTNGGQQRTAAETLADHVRRNGILLPKSTVAELNRLWGETQDPALRTALAAWGGSLRPGLTVTRERLEQIPRPVLPADEP